MEVVAILFTMETLILETLLILIHICSELCDSVQLNGSYAKEYSFIGARETNNAETEIKMSHLHKTRHGHKLRSIRIDVSDSVSNFLEIHWVNSSTDSISIKWNLSSHYNLTGFIKQSTVEYFPPGGRFTSHPLPSNVREYSITNLDAFTLYTICVHMTEVYGPHNKSSIKHSECVKINTIKFIRRESAVILIITLGYFVFMGLLGYTQWKRKVWDIQSKQRRHERETASNAATRWKEVAEKERLVPQPGCSKRNTTSL